MQSISDKIKQILEANKLGFDPEEWDDNQLKKLNNDVIKMMSEFEIDAKPEFEGKPSLGWMKPNGDQISEGMKLMMTGWTLKWPTYIEDKVSFGVSGDVVGFQRNFLSRVITDPPAN